jgi:uncharacterized membrane protein
MTDCHRPVPGSPGPARAGRASPRWVIACALAFGPCPGTAAAVAPRAADRPGDLASEVQTVFAAKCAECHGAHLPNPRGEFGYVLDLGRLGADPGLVVRSQPEKSKLWELIRDGEMPPRGAQGGPLTEAEKAAVRNWIAAGALAPALSSAGGSGAPPGAKSPRKLLSAGERLLRWLGKFHIVAVHFPIALLLAAALAELGVVCGCGEPLRTAARFCVLLGAAGAVAAVALGWLHSPAGAGSAGVLGLHRWLGTLAGLWAVGVAVVSEVDARRGQQSPLFRPMLWVGALLVGVTAHLGGTLVHGARFFDW